MSEALKKLKGAVLMSVVLVATDAGAKAPGLGHRLEPRWWLRVIAAAGAMPIWGAGAATWSHGDILA